MKIDYEWIQTAIDIISKDIVTRVVYPSGTATVEKKNGVLKVEIKGDME